ncbi:sigma-70 family RNA polymerase sigma factor [Methylobacterium trifolii]|nr:sigma-70 family RNA polymerase sigma factor [Methylobacterium trifolii]
MPVQFPSDESTDIPDVAYHAILLEHLSLPLQDYFTLTEREPLPVRLADLIAHFETRALERGRTVAFEFRDDLVKALPALRTFALSLCGDGSRADDLVQDTFVRAWTNWHRFTPGTNFTAWLFTILRNQLYTEMRKRKREIEDADGKHAGQMTILPAQEDSSTLQVVWSNIDALPLAQRQALLLVGAEGCTYEEAALKLGCQIGTVKSRVSRARACLAHSLGVTFDSQPHHVR